MHGSIKGKLATGLSISVIAIIIIVIVIVIAWQHKGKTSNRSVWPKLFPCFAAAAMALSHSGNTKTQFKCFRPNLDFLSKVWRHYNVFRLLINGHTATKYFRRISWNWQRKENIALQLLMWNKLTGLVAHTTMLFKQHQIVKVFIK